MHFPNDERARRIEQFDRAGARILPCVVHSAGKVGSTSLRQALDELGSLLVLQTHVLHPDRVPSRPYGLAASVPGHLYNSIFIRMGWLDRGYPILCLTGVREPVARNASEFFERNRRRIADLVTDDSADVTDLYEEFRTSFNHDEVDEWFDLELNDVFRLDIFSRPFDVRRGFQRMTASDGSEIVLYRSDLSDAEKALALKSVFGSSIHALRIPRSNVMSERGVARLYSDFMRTVGRDEDYLHKMLSCRMAVHFFSPGDRQRILRDWVSVASSS